ncbi:MAG: hypothetical protein PWP51_1869 [Clostridiales bacterium]|jgi:membrane AbrB-like protein|nr:hypothetical protein [Clostridiales bacterium]MDN5299316.1 hypothetical protein [Clostridiales bacterium]
MLKVVYTLLVAAIGGLIGLKLKIPAGTLIGSMVAVGLFNITTGQGTVPVNLKIGAQIVIGGIIGLNFTMDMIRQLRLMIVPALILIVGLTTFCLALAFIIHKTTGMDLMTALFSCSPGGLADMSILSEAYGAETAKVVVMHALRLMTVVMIFPVIFGFLARR